MYQNRTKPTEIVPRSSGRKRRKDRGESSHQDTLYAYIETSQENLCIQLI
jgi:hypothetical protein